MRVESEPADVFLTIKAASVEFIPGGQTGEVGVFLAPFPASGFGLVICTSHSILFLGVVFLVPRSVVGIPIFIGPLFTVVVAPILLS